MANMRDLSFSECLGSLPPLAFSCIWDVLSLIPESLATPFIKAKIHEVCGCDVTEQVVRNVVFKLRHFLGVPLPVATLQNVGAQTKLLQALAPEEGMCEFKCHRSVCPRCHTKLKPGATRDRRGIHMSAAFRGLPDAGENRFVLYSMSAGAQYCSFQDSYCVSCAERSTPNNIKQQSLSAHSYFLGGWQYKKSQASFGKVENIKWIG
jgi:hypothetical protein